MVVIMSIFIAIINIESSLTESSCYSSRISTDDDSMWLLKWEKTLKLVLDFGLIWIQTWNSLQVHSTFSIFNSETQTKR